MYFKDFLNNQSKTLIMGILNLTPDSFFDGGTYNDNNTLINRLKLLEKVEIIDIGCETSKPGSLKYLKETVSKPYNSLYKVQYCSPIDLCNA